MVNRVPIFMAFSGNGGVERMMANLMRAFVGRGMAVDLLVTRADGDHIASLPEQVRVIELGTGHTTRAAPALARYLARERPGSLLVAKDRAIRTAVRARRRAGVDTRIVGRLGTNLSASLQHKSPFSRSLRVHPMRRLYARVDRIVAVSQGVARDTSTVTGLPAERICVIRNPVVTADLLRQAEAPAEHPWLNDSGPPVILGVGRLTRQKDFATLIRAFAQVRRTTPCRLLILGEGTLRSELETLVRELGVADWVALPGFTRNPFSAMRNAALFVLSSAWEGSPNALTEALALGTPVVSTACPSGPDEILADGRYGRLVPVSDAPSLAQAMEATLKAPLPAERLREAVAEYTAERAAERYLQALGFTDNDRSG